MADEPTYRKQEQEPASEDVTEVAPGIVRIQLDVHLPGLGHVNCYVLEDDRGVAVVDPGLPGPDTYRTLEARLAEMNVTITDIHTAVVTHSHPDHFGGVYQLRDESGCEVLTHHEFRTIFDAREASEEPDSAALELATDDELEALRQRWSRPTPWGSVTEPPPLDAVKRFIASGRKGAKPFQVPEPSITVADEQVVELGRREWVAVHTPGHTTDHLCLFDPVGGVLLSGDHVLPTITPHISGLIDDDDPLNTFFESLRRMHTLDGLTLALPAHGHPFEQVGQRADEIIEHHFERLDVIRAAALDVPAGHVSDYMKRLFKERSWGGMAESETYAHLEHLRILGEVAVTVDPDGQTTYRF
ncbi:MAG: MBL fold metallo-hydrolase [Acidimicrobiales bacterium]